MLHKVTRLSLSSNRSCNAKVGVAKRKTKKHKRPEKKNAGTGAYSFGYIPQYIKLRKLYYKKKSDLIFIWKLALF